MEIIDLSGLSSKRRRIDGSDDNDHETPIRLNGSGDYSGDSDSLSPSAEPPSKNDNKTDDANCNNNANQDDESDDDRKFESAMAPIYSLTQNLPFHTTKTLQRLIADPDVPFGDSNPKNNGTNNNNNTSANNNNNNNGEKHESEPKQSYLLKEIAETVCLFF